MGDTFTIYNCTIGSFLLHYFLLIYHPYTCNHMSVYGHFNLNVNIIIVTLFLCSPLSVLCIIVLLYSAAIFHPICMEYGYIIVRAHINLSHAGMISKMMILLFHNCY